MLPCTNHFGIEEAPVIRILGTNRHPSTPLTANPPLFKVQNLVLMNREQHITSHLSRLSVSYCKRSQNKNLTSYASTLGSKRGTRKRAAQAAPPS